jgi:hypothetical protein
MRKTVFTALIMVFTASMIFPAFSQDSGDADVSIEVDRKCQAALYEYRLESGIVGDENYPLMGTGGTANFTYRPANLGEMAYIDENISIYQYDLDKVALGEGNLKLKSENSNNENLSLGSNSVNLTRNELDVPNTRIQLAEQEVEVDGVSLNLTSQYIELDGNNLSIPAQNLSLVENQDTRYQEDGYIVATDEVKLESQPVSNLMNLSRQTVNFSESYLLNSSSYDGYENISQLVREEDEVLKTPYWYDTSRDWGESQSPESIRKEKKFTAGSNFTDGIYQSDIELNYRCEFSPGNESDVFNTSTQAYTGFSEFNFTKSSTQEIKSHLLLDGLNISYAEREPNYTRTVRDQTQRKEFFKIVSIEGNGSTPDEITDGDRGIGRNLDADAEELDEADRVEGNNPDQPGETPVPEPEPEPEPEPTPLLSANIRPLNTTYTTSRGRYAEIGLEINNTGEETLSNLELEPRFSEGMDWDAQSGTIDSLEVGESVNQSVYVRANESVEPGIYQIPVYASNEENDIASQYVNVEITDEPVSASALSISEAPQDIRFEINNNYSVPVLLENRGDNDLENVSLELQNTENCGDYTAEQIESVAAGESASVSLKFNTSSNLQECEATIVASSSSGTFAFSEMTVRNVEERGIVPQEFRVPIVASLWTAMLVIYTVVIKRYGLNSMSVKIPMVILVVGEAFILIYLSSAYYGIFPPGLLPFSSA